MILLVVNVMAVLLVALLVKGIVSSFFVDCLWNKQNDEDVKVDYEWMTRWVHE